MNLLKLRKENKKTQQDMANLLGIKQNSYSKYELEETQPSIENLIKLADYFNVSIDFLVGRNWQNEIGYLTPPQKECVNIIKQLNETNLTKTIGYVNALLSTQ